MERLVGKGGQDYRIPMSSNWWTETPAQGMREACSIECVKYRGKEGTLGRRGSTATGDGGWAQRNGQASRTVTAHLPLETQKLEFTFLCNKSAHRTLV